MTERAAEQFVEDHAALQRLAADPIASALIEAMKGQLLIVLVNRLDGRAEIPVSEVDATGAWTLEMSIDQERGVFTFVTRKKN